MQIGTVTWNWFDDPQNTQTSKFMNHIIEEIAKLDLDNIDFIGTPESVEKFYTDQEIKKIKTKVDDFDLNIHTFVSSTPELNHPDEKEREKVIKNFKQAVEVGKKLGAEVINSTVPYPAGAEIIRNGNSADKFKIKFPEDYSWEKDWNNFIESLRKCVDIVTEAGLKMSLECFPYTICSTPHAWIKLLEEIDSPNLGIQLDTAHLTNQRHDISTAIHMIGGENIFNVHCKDSDGMARGNLPPGTGIVDYVEVIKTLNKKDYQGPLTIEVEFTRKPSRYVNQGKEHLCKILDNRF